jgi:hypothetical protein
MDLQKLSSLINNGKITPHLAIFLNRAFSFSTSSINSTLWIPLNNYKGGFIKNRIVKNALIKKKLDAITLNKEVIYSSLDLYSSKSDNGYQSWLELIVHEQFHRNEMEKLGWVYWYMRYGVESLRFGYRNAPSEKRAYTIAMGDNSKMETFLKTDLGNEFVAMCQDESLTQEQKNILAEGIALKASNTFVTPKF